MLAAGDCIDLSNAVSVESGHRESDCAIVQIKPVHTMELSALRLAVEAEYELKFKRLRVERDQEREKFTAIRLELEQAPALLSRQRTEELNEIKLRALLESEQAERSLAELKSNQQLSSMLLPEEQQAMLTDSVIKVRLKPQQIYAESNRAGEWHFRLAESQFHRMLGRDRRGTYSITGVDLIVNPTLRRRYELNLQAQRERGELVREKWTFHGAPTKAIVNAIVQGGFKIGGVDVPGRNSRGDTRGIYQSLHL